MNFQRGNKAGSAADVALQMTLYSVIGMGLFVCLFVCFTVKTLVELLFGIDDQILKKTFLVTKISLTGYIQGIFPQKEFTEGK